ncbi:hypothetical protein MKL09_00805 [Methylobacterium sp. J-048]|uniref:hypothetical protein n=1 Tax=Methylobacterium sp. J-048 TaxID=2836635 RepID=UPI001FBAC383|nr:hypothetical protein [Methylobacterium sp. J-048]MCJ2055096.1 hypothetical protein [Methylobacterium sp. J-048]
MNTLRDLLGPRRSTEPRERDRFLRRYGLSRNPFPPSRTILPEVMYNQSAALKKFADAVDAILDPMDISRRSVAVVGGTGAGKTHFLRHCQYLFKSYTDEEDCGRYVEVEYQAGTGSSVSLVREMLRRADDRCAKDGEFDLINGLINAGLNSSHVRNVRMDDLRKSLLTLLEASSPDFEPRDKNKVFTYEHLREVMKRWLAGNTLTATERGQLDVSGRLATAPIMIRVMSELFALAQSIEAIGGVLLCLDEIESVFSSGIATAKVQTFLQDLRYLFDESVKPELGYSLTIISASTQRGAASLRDYNFPLYQRLGFESENREELKSILSFEEAQDFANVYIDYEKVRSEEDDVVRRAARSPARSLIDEDDLQQALSKATPTRRGWSSGEPASQAQLLEALHHIVEEKRRETAAS